MVSKLQKKGKKGFTLVELIVVIAIIAILAAVAVPTTLHFVEEANVSAESQGMNIVTSLDAFIVEGVKTPYNILATDTNNTVLTELKAMDVNKSIGSIVLDIAAESEGKLVVTYTITGKEYGDKGAVLTGNASLTMTAAQIYKGANAEAKKYAQKVTFNYTDGKCVSASCTPKVK